MPILQSIPSRPMNDPRKLDGESERCPSCSDPLYQGHTAWCAGCRKYHCDSCVDKFSGNCSACDAIERQQIEADRIERKHPVAVLGRGEERLQKVVGLCDSSAMTASIGVAPEGARCTLCRNALGSGRPWHRGADGTYVHNDCAAQASREG